MGYEIEGEEYLEKINKIIAPKFKPASTIQQDIDFSILNAMLREYKTKKCFEMDYKIEQYTKDLVNLPDNWDNQGSKRFKTTTISRAKKLVNDICNYFIEQNLEIPIPKILPVPDGSLDIYWKQENYKLLINIPSNKLKVVPIYGKVKDSPEDELDHRSNYKLIKRVVIDWLENLIPKIGI